MKKPKDKVEEPKQDFVTKNDFTDFKSSILDVLQGLSDKIESQKAPERNVMMATAPEKTAKVFEQRPSAEPVEHNLDAISPDYQAIFEKYFDPADGFKGMLRGVSFKIEVPMNLSNAIEAYKDFYKKDVRHKVLDGQDIEGSMEAYCKLVTQNLRYNRKIMLRI